MTKFILNFLILKCLMKPRNFIFVIIEISTLLNVYFYNQTKDVLNP